MSSMWVGDIGTVRTEKITHEKWAIFTKILNYIKSSYIISMPKCPNILIIYFAYNKSWHIFVWGYRDMLFWRYQPSLGQKITQEKSSVFTNILNCSKSSSIISYAKLCQSFHFTNYLHTTQITYNLANPIFLSMPTVFFTYLKLLQLNQFHGRI